MKFPSQQFQRQSVSLVNYMLFALSEINISPLKHNQDNKKSRLNMIAPHCPWLNPSARVGREGGYLIYLFIFFT